MIARSILHIGFHKNGSTSIQHFAATYRERLAELGIAFYRGRHIDNNHVELHVAAMPPERVTPFKLARKMTGGTEYRAATGASLAQFSATTLQATALFSSEGLSYLRDPDELAWLKANLPGKTQVVACLREVQAYRESYRRMLHRHGIAPSDDRNSIAYLEDDSWLWRFDERLQAFRDCFGAENVAVIDYDVAMRRDGNIIPAFLRTLGVEAAFARGDWEGIFLNRRPAGGPVS